MATSNSDDMRLLVARSQAGEQAALNELIFQVQPGIYKLAQRFLFIPGDAEDATQEILLKMITRLSQFDGKSRFTTWVYAIAKNHLLDIKRRPSEQMLSLSEFGEDLSQGLEENPQQSAASLLLLEEVRIGCTLAMLQCLDRESRLTYILGDILELEHQEAAEVLDITPAAYRKRLSRIRVIINDFMKENCGLVEPSNACRCAKRVERAQELQRIDAKKLLFATSRQRAEQFPQLLQTIRELEQHKRAAAIYRAQQTPAVSDNFANWLKTTLLNPRQSPTNG